MSKPHYMTSGLSLALIRSDYWRRPDLAVLQFRFQFVRSRRELFLALLGCSFIYNPSRVIVDHFPDSPA